MTCYNCNKTGHMSRECTEPRSGGGGGGGGGGSCYSCGQSGAVTLRVNCFQSSRCLGQKCSGQSYTQFVTKINKVNQFYLGEQRLRFCVDRLYTGYYRNPIVIYQVRHSAELKARILVSENLGLNGLKLYFRSLQSGVSSRRRRRRWQWRRS